MRRALCVGLLLLAGCGGAQTNDTRTDRATLTRACEPLYYELPGRPDLVIASDLPMRGEQRTAMLSITQAIKVIVKDREFRAGKFKVGYLVCDDSGPAGEWSADRCAFNAHEYSRLHKLVAVIGTLDSGCARVELPTLNAARLVLLSPLNTASDLTRVPGFARTGVSYARLVPSEPAQATLLARFAHDRGARTVAMVDDGTAYGRGVARAFERAARSMGMDSVAVGADAVFVGGTLSGRTHVLLERARVRGRMVLLSNGFTPVVQLSDVAGDAAEGVFVGVPGIPVEHLPPRGRTFARRFETLLGSPPHPYAVYGAQAANVLIAAIASAGPGRNAVRRAVLATRIPNGLVGPVAFDARGEPTPAEISVFRVVSGAPKFEQIVESGVP